MKNLLYILPILGLVLLRANYTSADLNDEVTIKTNSIKATTMEVAIQNSVDNSKKNYLFELKNFQKDSLTATTVRIRNIGNENSKYYFKISQKSGGEKCKELNLKIFENDILIFKDKIENFNLQLKELNKGEKTDLVMLLSDETAVEKLPTLCSYQMELSTKIDSNIKRGFYDIKKLESQVELE